MVVCRHFTKASYKEIEVTVYIAIIFIRHADTRYSLTMKIVNQKFTYSHRSGKVWSARNKQSQEQIQCFLRKQIKRFRPVTYI